jgi:hypothetical protein
MGIKQDLEASLEDWSITKKINGQQTEETVSKLETELAKQRAPIPTTNRGGQHGHAARHHSDQTVHGPDSIASGSSTVHFWSSPDPTVHGPARSGPYGLPRNSLHESRVKRKFSIHGPARSEPYGHGPVCRTVRSGPSWTVDHGIWIVAGPYLDRTWTRGFQVWTVSGPELCIGPWTVWSEWCFAECFLLSLC